MNEPKKLPQQSLTYATEPDLRSRAWIEISREALEHNVAYLRSLLPHGCTLMPVVKANAYGHGAGLIAGELSALGIRSFCVACVSEGVELRRQKIEGEILVLGYTHPDQFPLLDQYALTQTVADQAHALALSAYACSASRRLLFSCSCASDGVPGQPASSSGSVDCEYRRASQAAIPQQPASSPGSVDCEYRHASQAAILRQPASSSGSVDCEYRRASQVTAPGDPPPLPVQVAVDTGMRRLGVPAEQEGCIREIFALPGLQITGLYSHLAASGGVDDASQNFTQNQIDAFRLLTERLGLRRLQEGGHTREAVHAPVRLHLQASYGILHYPMPDMDCARPGIALYGLLSNASDTCVYGEQLRPVLSLRARVASVRRLSQGESAGYDMAYTAARVASIATVTIGYADGLPRSLSEGKGCVLLHGQRAPIIGRICMDQLLVDVTALPHTRPGEIVTLIGRDGRESISAADLADACGTITNELLSCLGARLERLIL